MLLVVASDEGAGRRGVSEPGVLGHAAGADLGDEGAVVAELPADDEGVAVRAARKEAGAEASASRARDSSSLESVKGPEASESRSPSASPSGKCIPSELASRAESPAV